MRKGWICRGQPLVELFVRAVRYLEMAAILSSYCDFCRSEICNNKKGIHVPLLVAKQWPLMRKERLSDTLQCTVVCKTTACLGSIMVTLAAAVSVNYCGVYVASLALIRDTLG